MDKTKKIDLVIYHADCPDGFCAAWLLGRKLAVSNFLPARHGDAPPDVTGKRVIVVDFSYKRDVLVEMDRQAERLLVLDHHKTAEEELRGLDFCVFNQNRSGAGMVHELFYGQGETQEMFHAALGRELWEYVQDRDLWRFDLPYSREVNAFISTYPKTFAAWDSLATVPFEEARSAGVAVLASRDRLVDQACGSSGFFPDCEASVVNSSVLQSEIGDRLCLTAACSHAAIWCLQDGYVNVSLRSRSGFDVSEVAKRHGGGGHKNAAGYRFPAALMDPLRPWVPKGVAP
jgi:uncharacterized protein